MIRNINPTKFLKVLPDLNKSQYIWGQIRAKDLRTDEVGQLFPQSTEKMTDMEKIQEMFVQIQTRMQAMDSKMGTIITEIDNIRQENRELKGKVEKQQERIESLEREIRRKNLIFRGVQDSGKEDAKDTKRKVIEVIRQIGVEIDPETDIDEIMRMGRIQTGRTRPIIMKMTTREKKFEILKHAKELQGTKIWIDEDYPREIQEERRQLIAKLRELKDQGHRAKIRYNKLIVNGEIYEVKNAEVTKMAHDPNQRENKRTVSERSPQGSGLEEQLRKVSRITKN